MITKVQVSNFTSLRKVEAQLGKVNLLIGKRGSGKTNFIKSLVTMNDLSNNINYYDHIQFIQETKPVTFCVDAVLDGNEMRLFQSVSDEGYTETMFVGDTRVINVAAGNGTIQDIDERSALVYNSKKQVSCIKECYIYGEKPNIKRFAEFMSKWSGYKYEGDNADNIEAGVNWIRYNDEDDYNDFFAFTERVVGGAIDFNNENVFINYGRYKTHISTLSDGELMLMAMKLNTYGSYLKHVTVLACIHIENGLDFSGKQYMAEILNDVVHDGIQVIIETHTPEFVDIVGDAFGEVNVLYFHKHDNIGTQIFTLDTLKERHAGLEGWINDFGLGSALLESNLIYNEGDK